MVTLRDSLRSFRNRQVKGSKGTGSAEGLTRKNGACREPSGRSLVELMGAVPSWGVGCPGANTERTQELRESSVQTWQRTELGGEVLDPWIQRLRETSS